MIALEHVTKAYRTARGIRFVIHEASCVFERGKNVAILGDNAEAKSTLLKLMSGKLRPSAGRVRRKGHVFSGLTKMPPSLTGVENAKFACRIYGMDIQSVLDYISRFTQLGSALNDPLMTYSNEMRTRFAVGLSLGLRFDVYLVDACGSALDARFLRHSGPEFDRKPRTRNLILVSENEKVIRKYCSHAVILKNGKLGEIMPVDEALV